MGYQQPSLTCAVVFNVLRAQSQCVKCEVDADGALLAADLAVRGRNTRRSSFLS